MMNKKGIITHPATVFILGIIIGAAVMYYIFAKGIL